jgi:hypothetical protein
MPKAQYPVTEYLDAARETILPRKGRAKISANEMAGRLDMAPSTLMAILDTYLAFQVHFVPPIVNASGDTLLIERLCEDCGGAFVKTPAGQDLDLVTIPAVVGAFGKLCTTACKSLRDGAVTAEEAKRVSSEGHAVVRAVLGLIGEMKLKSQGQVQG